MKEALKIYASKGDLIILISSSGASQNIINCAYQARKMKLKTVTFSGFKETNPLKKIGDLNFWVNSDEYNHVEMVHHIWILSICDYIKNN
jgi:D-sedoheptulose 7-phosphate isomerase